ncbi:flagellar basal body-associated FliL family protein [Rhodococcus sp. X156]|uniref:flagellar basal body-associated FliL family protein n=1 Tax=Rhodococcus sp. X156 TaxID=2499145 RepID=UPI000FDA4CBE|nr:flagellar basal body-associated FliL family protein [Rhodococcus sp. X156]
MPVDTAPTTRAASSAPSGAAAAGAKRRSGDATDAPAKAGAGRKKIIVIAVVVLLLAAAGYFFLAPSGEEGPPEPGPVVAMETTTLNLADGHFLRVKIALQTVLGADEALDTSKAAQLVISELSNRPMASLSTEAARTEAKTALLGKLQQAYPDQIMDLYYTEFVMQ